MADTFKAQFDLPTTLSRDIGNLITRYAYLEQYMQYVIYMLMGTSAGIGRLAIRETNLTGRLDLVLDLVAAKRLKLPDQNFKDIREAIEDAQDMRNLCAHGTWMWSPEHRAWAVLVSRGQWAGIDKSDRARRNKRLFPEGQVVRQKTLQRYIVGLEALRESFKKLQADLETKLQSPEE